MVKEKTGLHWFAQNLMLFYEFVNPYNNKNEELAPVLYCRVCIKLSGLKI